MPSTRNLPPAATRFLRIGRRRPPHPKAAAHGSRSARGKRPREHTRSSIGPLFTRGIYETTPSAMVRRGRIGFGRKNTHDPPFYHENRAGTRGYQPLRVLQPMPTDPADTITPEEKRKAVHGFTAVGAPFSETHGRSSAFSTPRTPASFGKGSITRATEASQRDHKSECPRPPSLFF